MRSRGISEPAAYRLITDEAKRLGISPGEAARRLLAREGG